MSDDDDKPADGDIAGRERRFEALRDRLQAIEDKARKKQRASKLEMADEKCSFCGREKDQVGKLLQAESGATICDACIRKFAGGAD